MPVDLDPLLHHRHAHSPLSVRQGLRLGTMTDDEARAHLAAWGAPEREIQRALDSGGWADPTT